jgi:hypothetical protein
MESLLRQAVMQGPKAPLTPKCLGIRAILTLLDHPADVRQEDLRHLAGCRYCQRAVALARRERGILDASWPEQADDVGSAPPDAGPIEQKAEPAAVPRPIKLHRWLTGLPALAGIAAMVVVVVGVGWWLTRDRPTQIVAVAPDLLGDISGEFPPPPVTRGGEPRPGKRKYEVSVELKTPAHLASLYIGPDRTLKLMLDDNKWAESQGQVGSYKWPVTFVDDESGPQWIVVLASKDPINRTGLRDELRVMIDALPKDASFDEIIGRLEQVLKGRREFSFRGHRFEVPALDAP